MRVESRRLVGGLVGHTEHHGDLSLGRFGEAIRDLLALIGQPAQREILLALEVVEQRSARHPCRYCYFIDRGRVESLLGEKAESCLRDERTHHIACLLADGDGTSSHAPMVVQFIEGEDVHEVHLVCRAGNPGRKNPAGHRQHQAAAPSACRIPRQLDTERQLTNTTASGGTRSASARVERWSASRNFALNRSRMRSRELRIVQQRAAALIDQVAVVIPYNDLLIAQALFL